MTDVAQTQTSPTKPRHENLHQLMTRVVAAGRLHGCIALMNNSEAGSVRKAFEKALGKIALLTGETQHAQR
jgi:hypothetical protein